VAAALIVGYSRDRILAMAFLIEGGALGAALVLARYFEIPLVPLSDSIVKDILLGTIGALPPFVFFLFSLSEKAEKIRLIGALRKKIITEIKDIFDTMHLSDVIIISLLAGIGEELLFRGVVQAKYGIVAASIIFGLMHSVSFAYVIVTIVMGFYIGVIYSAGGSLLIPIQLHFIYDLAALVYLKYVIKRQGEAGGS